VCSCTILPLFGGIYKKGAGIGPATTFLFTGPAINIAAIFLTARVLGWDLGIARMIATITAAIIIGLIMELLFKEKGVGGFVQTTSDGTDNVKAIVFFLIQLLFIIVSGLKINPTVKYSSLGVLGLSTLTMAVFGFEKTKQRAG